MTAGAVIEIMPGFEVTQHASTFGGDKQFSELAAAGGPGLRSNGKFVPAQVKAELKGFQLY